MSLLSTPLHVTRTLKNMGRIRQIAGTFARHGYDEALVQLGFGRFLPRARKKNISESISAPEHLRLAFEELGPTFIKLGQLLSSRNDLLSPAYIEELSKLQDRVSPLPFAAIKSTVEQELGTTLETNFKSFSEEPLASASIGQVHEAVLQDGKKVVVKVQRAGIDSLIKTDLAVLSMLASAAEKYFPELKVLAPSVLVEEFFQAMSLELNFLVEANNLVKAKENFADFPQVYIPEVCLDLCTHKILVVEKLTGMKLNDPEALRAQGFDCKLLSSVLAKSFLKSALEDGFFHGDLHLGNLFALPGNKIGMIDFGIVGHLSPQARESLIRIFIALAKEDFETLCMEYAELGSSRGRTDFDGFHRAVRAAIAPYIGMPLSRMNAGQILVEATCVAARHNIRIPREWMIVFRGIYALEGTCKKLDPDFNAIPLLESYVAPMLKSNYSWQDFSKDMTLGSRDLQYVIQSLPRQLHWLLKKMASNGYALETRNLEDEFNRTQSEKNFRILASAILSGALIITSGALFIFGYQQQNTELKILGAALLVLAGFIALFKHRG